MVADAAAPMLSYRRLVLRYAGGGGVGPLDLDVPPGTTTALIGPSGCGKSTLVRLAIGLVEPTEGELHFEGRRLDARAVPTARRRMGYVIQEGGLFPHLTATDNVTLMARHLGLESRQVSQRLDELAELTHLDKALLQRFPGELSGGQRQRVALMRALMLDPDILLLDEPLGALDPMIRYRLQQDLRAIFHSLGKTVLLVTHDLAEARYFAHRLVLLRDGLIEQSGSPDELVQQPSTPFVREFLEAQHALPQETPEP